MRELKLVDVELWLKLNQFVSVLESCITEAFEDLIPCLFIETSSCERICRVGEFPQSLAGF